MKEYKTVDLEFGHGIFTKRFPDIQSALNENAREGWELIQILEPSKNFGETSKFILVLERDAEHYLKP
ncbi:MAG: DUF4177 domain-containing protein [Burkholderiales bacterium]|nr:DUF4177 domain-containing protein [Burkholderiales bacterium]